MGDQLKQNIINAILGAPERSDIRNDIVEALNETGGGGGGGGGGTTVNAYTKAQTDNLLAKKADKTELADYAKKTDTTAALNAKADKTALAAYQTTAQATAALALKADKTELANYQTTAATTAALALKADKTELEAFYTKEQADTLLNGKAAVSALANYYLKSETYSRQEITDLLDGIKNGLTVQIVDSLPVDGISTKTIYLIKHGATNVYNQHMYIGGEWANLGSTQVDLTDYYTKADVDGKLALKVDTATFTAAIDECAKKTDLTQYAKTTDVATCAKTADLATVATTGAYGDLTGAPALKPVATSGSYTDLTDKPVIPTLPNLATVATTGSYADLTGTPTIPQPTTVPTANGVPQADVNGKLDEGWLDLTAYLDNVPIGTVQDFAANTLPQGWLKCDGATVSQAVYPELYAVIGTTYGPANNGTFTLPNLINKFRQGAAKAGTVKAAGLPNITGSLGISIEPPTGAVSNATPGTVWQMQVVSSGGAPSYRKELNASLSSSIYGNSTTVQPPAVTMVPMIKAKATLAGVVATQEQFTAAVAACSPSITPYAQYATDLFVPTTNPTLVWWDKNTLNTPYKEGLVGNTIGVALCDGNPATFFTCKTWLRGNPREYSYCTASGDVINGGWVLSGSSDAYSTTEMCTGRWIDGKPVYSKTITAASKVNSIATGIKNLKEMVSIRGCCKTESAGNTYWQAMPLATPASGVLSQHYFDTADNALHLIWGNFTSTITSIRFILEYTKTTD